MPGINANIFTAQTQHAVYSQRVFAGIAKRFDSSAKNVDKLVRSELGRHGSRFESQTDAMSAARRIKRQIEREYLKFISDTRSSMRELTQIEIDFQYRIFIDEAKRILRASSDEKLTNAELERLVEKEFGIKKPVSKKVFEVATKEPIVLNDDAYEIESLYRQFVEQESSRISAAVLAGASGLVIAAIIANIRGTSKAGFTDGLIAVSARNASSIVRTVAAHHVTFTQAEFFSINDDHVIGYQIIATLDGRTSNICRGFDGHVILNSAAYKPKPPFHFRCRTQITPAFRAGSRFASEAGLRASRGSQGGTPVKGELTYYEWLKTQPAWFQDDAIGKVRGKIFRNSGLSAEEFRSASVDGLNRPLTIAEMTEKNSSIMNYINEIGYKPPGS